MSTALPPWQTSALLLAAAGTIVVAIGAYFLVLRPALLPEDIRYLSLSPAEAATLGPRLAPWLTQLFRVLGGYAIATGVLAIALSASAFRARQPIAVVGAAVAGASSIGLMAAVNFAIDSDFKWRLLVPAAIWLLSLVAFFVETRRAPASSRENNRKGI